MLNDTVSLPVRFNRSAFDSNDFSGQRRCSSCQVLNRVDDLRGNLLDADVWSVNHFAIFADQLVKGCFAESGSMFLQSLFLHVAWSR